MFACLPIVSVRESIVYKHKTELVVDTYIPALQIASNKTEFTFSTIIGSMVNAKE